MKALWASSWAMAWKADPQMSQNALGRKNTDQHELRQSSRWIRITSAGILNGSSGEGSSPPLADQLSFPSFCREEMLSVWFNLSRWYIQWSWAYTWRGHQIPVISHCCFRIYSLFTLYLSVQAPFFIDILMSSKSPFTCKKHSFFAPTLQRVDTRNWLYDNKGFEFLLLSKCL